SRSASAYYSDSLANRAAILVFLAASLFLRTPGALLTVAGLLAMAAVATTHRVVVRGVRDSNDQPEASIPAGASQPFVVARAAFLLVVAGLPAIACFEAAYSCETGLLAKSENVQREKDWKDLLKRNSRAAEPLGLKTTSDIQAFVDRRSELLSNLSNVP